MNQTKDFFTHVQVAQWENSCLSVFEVNPTWGGVEILWIGGGGAKSAPPP